MKKDKLILLLVGIILLAIGLGYFIGHHNKPKPTNQYTSVSASQSVDLSGQQLTTIPESVLKQTNITNLNLSNNQLTALPADIENLTNLKTLNVENNRLITIPAEIGQLKNLQVADFSNNRLTSLPSELGNLTQLKSLNLSDYKGPASDIDQLKTRLPNTQIKS